jgi:DNA repair exonuclease SbcCD ATPase subunit
MQRELDNARSQAESSKRDYQTAKSGDDAQLQQWKERYARLEADMAQSREELSRSNKHLNENDVSWITSSYAYIKSPVLIGRPVIQSAEAIKELQNELIILMEELKAVSARNEELMAERDEDGELIQQLEADVADYKRKWETTRTQLRNLKGKYQVFISVLTTMLIDRPTVATSTMFVSKPITEDHMPASLDGNIADIHVTAFQSAIDNLLAIAR